MNFLSSILVCVSVMVTQSSQMPEGGWFQTLLPGPIIVPVPFAMGYMSVVPLRPKPSTQALPEPSKTLAIIPSSCTLSQRMRVMASLVPPVSLPHRVPSFAFSAMRVPTLPMVSLNPTVVVVVPSPCPQLFPDSLYISRPPVIAMSLSLIPLALKTKHRPA